MAGGIRFQAETYVKLFIMQQQEITDLFYETLHERDEMILETIKRKYKFFQNLLENIPDLEMGSLVVEEEIGGTAERMAKKMMKELGLG